MVLITGHRRENFGEGFMHICFAIRDLAKTFSDVDFVYPMHLNPNVRKPIHEVFGSDYRNIIQICILSSRLTILPFVYMMDPFFYSFNR